MGQLGHGNGINNRFTFILKAFFSTIKRVNVRFHGLGPPRLGTPGHCAFCWYIRYTV